MDLFVVHLAVLFLPGLIWVRLDARYATKKSLNQFEILIRAFMYGLATYAIVYLGYELTGRQFSMADATKVSNETLNFDNIIDEILWSIPTAFILGVLWVYASTYKVRTRFLQTIGATKRYGDEDVWDFTLNSSSPVAEYVHVHDFSKELIFAGWVDTFSETEKLRELVLKDVKIMDFDAYQIAEYPRLYISRDSNDLTIEFPYQGDEQGDRVEEE